MNRLDEAQLRNAAGAAPASGGMSQSVYFQGHMLGLEWAHPAMGL